MIDKRICHGQLTSRVTRSAHVIKELLQAVLQGLSSLSSTNIEQFPDIT
jgi:hypothetical protein